MSPISSVKGKEAFPHLAQNTPFSWFVRNGENIGRSSIQKTPFQRARLQGVDVVILMTPGPIAFNSSQRKTQKPSQSP